MPRTVAPIVPEGRMRELEQPTFDLTEGRRVRPWLETDADWAIAAFQDPDIRFWHMRTLDDPAEARTWIASELKQWGDEGGASWAIVDADDAPLGRIAFHGLELEYGFAEVAYWILPDARRRGTLTAALEALTDWCFDVLGLHRLELLHGVENEASCQAAERCGYRSEGILRSSLLHEDGWHDMHIHGRIADDERR